MVHLYVFRSFMKDRIIGYVACSLIVTKQRRRHSRLTSSSFSNHLIHVTSLTVDSIS
ncbi:hypothetical protein HanRHA438_Chr09g0379901 [Helianthus annuus]|nr:hypothetical protein HanRHA438_Chr09g0379901 [Helianthus annuus]